jgi:thermitase
VYIVRKFLFFFLSFFTIASSFLFLGQVTTSAKSPQTLDHVPGQILVKFKDGTSSLAINDELKKQNGKITNKINGIDTLVVSVPDAALDKVIEALSKNPHVEYAEENNIAVALDYPTTAPDDTYFAGNQWGLENAGQTIVGQTGSVNADIDAQSAWSKTTGTSTNSAIRVAVLDTGIDAAHPDLSTKIDLAKDFTGSSTSTDDIYGHGTHVSGIVAAITNNGKGVAGTCPDCRLLVGKVLNDSGSGANSWIANGITWATQNGAKVINMSLGSSAKSATLESAVNYAWKNGVVVVAAAGNSANPSKTYPGAYTNVIAVAATDNKDKKASFSSYGSWVDVAAPGVNIFSTFPTHTFTLGTQNGRSQNYDFGSGTSMATPMVAGTVALIWSTSYGTTNTAVRSRLELTADKIQGTGNYWSAGRINAGKAVTPQ